MTLEPSPLTYPLTYSIIVGIIRLANLKHLLKFVKDDVTLAESLYIFLYDDVENGVDAKLINYDSYPTITISSTGNIKLRADKSLRDKLNSVLGFDGWKDETNCCAFYGNPETIIFGLASLLLVKTFAK